MWSHLEAKSMSPVVLRRECIHARILTHNAIAHKLQLALPRHRRIKLPDRSRTSIPRIRKQRLTQLCAFRIHALKLLCRQNDFTTNFEAARVDFVR